MLSWFDQNPDRYWWLVCCAIAGTLFTLLRPLLRTAWQDNKRTDWGWSVVILVVLIVGRWPTWFVAHDLNPDESQLIAGAITLRHDPVFWRSVDGGTAGPLDFFALWPAGCLHGKDDYLSARVSALGLIAAALVFAHQSIALVFGRLTARVTGFATLCFESLTLHSDFLHYSTELVAVSFVAAAFYLAVRRFVCNAGWRGNAVGGLLLGAMPFTKLQALPLAGLLGLGWMAVEIWLKNGHPGGWRHRLFPLCAALAAPGLGCGLLLTVTGQWQHAVVCYLLSNVVYINAAPLEISQMLLQSWRSAFHENSLLVYWLAGGGLWLLLALLLPRAKNRPARFVAAAAVVLCLASLVCIFVPLRPFLHYWQLFVVPWTLVLGSITGLVIEALENHRTTLRCGVLCAALLCTTGSLLYVRASCAHPDLGWLTQYYTSLPGTVAKEVMKYAQPGESLCVWGWMNTYYVETGLRQATLHAPTPAEIFDSPYRDYFRRRYLADIRRSDPPVFVDATGPGNFYFQSRSFAHDAIFPELAAYIRSHYTQVADVAGSRIYVGHDFLPPRALRPLD